MDEQGKSNYLGQFHQFVIFGAYTVETKGADDPMIGNYLKKHKQIPAIAAALGMTLIMGLAILGVGVNALLNPNTQPVLASSGSVESASTAGTALTAADTTQVQELLAQYQAREQQYKTELQQAATQLNLANQQISQYQSLISGLENAGVIQINPDGRVFISGGRFRNDDGD